MISQIDASVIRGVWADKQLLILFDDGRYYVGCVGWVSRSEVMRARLIFHDPAYTTKERANPK